MKSANEWSRQVHNCLENREAARRRKKEAENRRDLAMRAQTDPQTVVEEGSTEVDGQIDVDGLSFLFYFLCLFPRTFIER